MAQLKNSGNPPNTLRAAKRIRTNRSLIPVTTLVSRLGLRYRPKHFDINSFIPVTYVLVKELSVDKEFQRWIIENFINETDEFDGALARPLSVFLRPNGEYSIVDGQHEVVLAILLTTLGPELPMPCQVVEHPSTHTVQQCIDDESVMFKKLNRNRTNISTTDMLRANIGRNDEVALKTENDLIEMGVNIEKIGDPEGPEVHGFKKLLDAHTAYGLAPVRKSIHLYRRLQKDKRFSKWNKITKPLKGSIIGGLAATYHLLDGQALGEASKRYALNDYLENYLGNESMEGAGSISHNTAGSLQFVLIARRIVDGCNRLITNRIIKKENGDILKNVIGDDTLGNAGLGDPSKRFN